MKVLKFGGTSVGNAGRMKGLLDIIDPNERQIIVLSAVSGTTNHLLQISGLWTQGQRDEGLVLLAELKSNYNILIAELFEHSKEYHQSANDLIDSFFNLLSDLSGSLFTALEERIVVAQGELMSTTLFHLYNASHGNHTVLLPALDFMKIDENQEPDVAYIKTHLEPFIQAHPETNVFITQGFICRNDFGEVDNLRRGGSDYTASLIGAAIGADEVQIWTDIDGMHNNDPRIVKGTKPLAKLSFDEAAELAYFGAKILHPQSVFPAQKYKIPVRVLNTMDPKQHGTLITTESEKGKIKSIAAKDGITAIRIQSSRMLLAYGFLRQVFEIFERYKTPIDMITTSEVAVSVTIDKTDHLDQIIDELNAFGTVDIDRDQSIVCVVGDFGTEKHGFAVRVLEALKHIPIRMISYGGSNFNISLLIQSENKTEALRSLHDRLF